MLKNRYPKISIRSRNELAKHISSKTLPYDVVLGLINDVIANFNKYWYDSSESEPEKGKFVRSAIGTPLNKLLKLIDQKVLAPHDRLIPDFIFGGVSGKNHIQAAYYLLGKRRDRTLLGLDIKRFFEQINQQRIFYLFYSRCGCSVEGANLLAQLCCVPLGPKNSGGVGTSIARGFATSPRLALWSNLDTFIKISWVVKKKLKGHDPKIAIFVDDIGIDASRVTPEKMEEVFKKINDVLVNFDHNQRLPINPDKKKLQLHSKGAEHLGLKLGRNKLAMGRRTRSRKDNVKILLSRTSSETERSNLKIKKISYYKYQQQINKVQLKKN